MVAPARMLLHAFTMDAYLDFLAVLASGISLAVAGLSVRSRAATSRRIDALSSATAVDLDSSLSEATPFPPSDGAWVAVSGQVTAATPLLSLNKCPSAVILERITSTSTSATRSGTVREERLISQSWSETPWALESAKPPSLLSSPSRVFIARDAVRQAWEKEPNFVLGGLQQGGFQYLTSAVVRGRRHGRAGHH